MQFLKLTTLFVVSFCLFSCSKDANVLTTKMENIVDDWDITAVEFIELDKQTNTTTNDLAESVEGNIIFNSGNGLYRFDSPN